MTADPADFGGRLRQARETQGMSLAQIAASTKISTMVLEALERNDASRLPGGLFSRAFVRAYAREVGLDPERTVEEFVARFADDVEGGDQTKRGTSMSVGSRRSGPGLRWLGLVATVALIGLFLGVQRYLTRKDVPAGTPPPPSPVSAVATQTPGAPPQGQEAAPTGQATTAPAVISPPPETPVAQIPAAVQPPGAPAADRTPSAPVAAQPAAAVVPTAEDTQAAPAALRLVLTTTSQCWVSAKVDGTRAAGRLVPSGERVELAAADAIVLTLGDAGAVTYTLNGAPGRALGKPGETVTVVINAANHQGYIQR